MSQLSIQLDPVALREATSQAIMGILTPEVKERVIRTAINNLLGPTDNYNSKSQLQIAFDQAVVAVARESVKEMVANDQEIKEKVMELARETARKVFNMDTDKLAEKMADAFCSSIKGDRY